MLTVILVVFPISSTTFTIIHRNTSSSWSVPLSTLSLCSLFHSQKYVVIVVSLVVYSLSLCSLFHSQKYVVIVVSPVVHSVSLFSVSFTEIRHRGQSRCPLCLCVLCFIHRNSWSVSQKYVVIVVSLVVQCPLFVLYFFCSCNVSYFSHHTFSAGCCALLYTTLNFGDFACSLALFLVILFVIFLFGVV